MNKPIIKILSMTILFLGFFSFLPASKALALDCNIPNIDEAAEVSDIVIYAKINKTLQNQSYYEAQPIKIWKGTNSDNLTKPITVNLSNDWGDRFEIGESYILFLEDKGDNLYVADVCLPRITDTRKNTFGAEQSIITVVDILNSKFNLDIDLNKTYETNRKPTLYATLDNLSNFPINFILWFIAAIALQLSIDRFNYLFFQKVTDRKVLVRHIVKSNIREGLPYLHFKKKAGSPIVFIVRNIILNLLFMPSGVFLAYSIPFFIFYLMQILGIFPNTFLSTAIFIPLVVLIVLAIQIYIRKFLRK